MPELPDLEIVRDMLKRRILGQSIVSADVIPPSGPIVVRDLTGAGFATAIAGALSETVNRMGEDIHLNRRGGN